LIILLLLTGAVWFNDHTGVSNAIVSSWQFLSGVATPDEVVGDCPASTDTNAWVIVELSIAVASGLAGIAAIVGIPAGTIHSLITRKKDGVALGLSGLAMALAALVLAGLLMRLNHGMTAGIGRS
jgi:hypothetical protein